jgi:hypothetical protein
MPESKHRKKGQTARQFRKSRNNRYAERAVEEKFKKLDMMRAMQAINNTNESKPE